MNLDELVSRRDKLLAGQNRIQGQIDAAKASLAVIEEECRTRNILPENLPDVVSKLKQKAAAAQEKAEQDLLAAEQALQPYLKLVG